MKTKTLKSIALAAATFACIGVNHGSVATALQTAAATPPATADKAQAEPTPVPLENNVAKLTPANSKIEFVGAHVGDEPKPRLGGFREFKGQLQVSADGKPVALSLDFNIDSVWTEIGNGLDEHLKQDDFFDVANYPTAKFVSTKVAPLEGTDKYSVTGDFTMHGETQEITIPAIVSNTPAGILLGSKFNVDRTMFGMKDHEGHVEHLVAIEFSVGEPTKLVGAAAELEPATETKTEEPTTEESTNNRRRNFDPEAMFKERDADGDGKLTGDEIPQRMQDRIESFDTDEDGSISLEELQERVKAFRNRQ